MYKTPEEIALDRMREERDRARRWREKTVTRLLIVASVCDDLQKELVSQCIIKSENTSLKRDLAAKSVVEHYLRKQTEAARGERDELRVKLSALEDDMEGEIGYNRDDYR